MGVTAKPKRISETGVKKFRGKANIEVCVAKEGPGRKGNRRSCRVFTAPQNAAVFTKLRERPQSHGNKNISALRHLRS